MNEQNNQAEMISNEIEHIILYMCKEQDVSSNKLKKFSDKVITFFTNNRIEYDSSASFNLRECFEECLKYYDYDQTVDIFLSINDYEALIENIKFLKEFYDFRPALSDFSELAHQINTLITHWQESKNSIIKTGYLETHFLEYPWLLICMKHLYPIDPPVLSKYKISKETLLIHKKWGDISSPGTGNPIGDLLIFDEKYENEEMYEQNLKQLNKLRNTLYDVYLIIFDLLHDSAINRDSKSLWENCVQVLREKLTSSDIVFFLELDFSLNKLYFDKCKEDYFPMVREQVFEPGCLFSLFCLIGYYEKEIDDEFGTFRKTRDALSDFIKAKNDNIPHLIIKSIFEENTDSSIDSINSARLSYNQLLEKEQYFWVKFSARFKEEYSTELENTKKRINIVRNIRKKHIDVYKESGEKYADNLVTEVENFNKVIPKDTNLKIFEHSPKYRIIKVDGEPIELTPTAAKFVKYLDESFYGLSQEELLDKLADDRDRPTNYISVQQILKDNPELKKIVIYGRKRGIYLLKHKKK